MTDGYGNISWWGFSPALDLQQRGLEAMCKKAGCSAPDDLNILVVGAGDIRHILTTIARRNRHKKRKLNFFVVESALELYARDMMLMMVVLELQQNMGLQEKTEVFLEIHGNTLLRQQTSDYIQKMSHQLIRMVTDFDYMAKKFPIFDLDQLKYKERDFLEGVLKYWRNQEKVKSPFDISKCWDMRLRQLLGVRYDSRLNAFDWDYNMEMNERGGSIIHLQQYKSWRSDGIAYTIREGTYDVPNRTLSSAMVFKHEGERYPRRGYWGDMVVSPYVSFGVETEEKSLYKKQNNQHTKTAEDVAEYNITSLLHELMTGKRYELPKVDVKDKGKEDPVKQTATLEEIVEESGITANEHQETNDKDAKGDEEEGEEELDAKIPVDSELYEWSPLDDVKITFLPLSCVKELGKKSKYQKFFNVVSFSNSMVHLLTPEIASIFADKCAIVAETALFMLSLKKPEVQEFFKRVSGLATNAGCKPLEEVDDLQDSYAAFYYER